MSAAAAAAAEAAAAAGVVVVVVVMVVVVVGMPCIMHNISYHVNIMSKVHQVSCVISSRVTCHII